MPFQEFTYLSFLTLSLSWLNNLHIKMNPLWGAYSKIFILGGWICCVSVDRREKKLFFSPKWRRKKSFLIYPAMYRQGLGSLLALLARNHMAATHSVFEFSVYSGHIRGLGCVYGQNTCLCVYTGVSKNQDVCCVRKRRPLPCESFTLTWMVKVAQKTI